MRLISFFLTTQQFLDGSKDVTRRLGWKWLKPGTRLMAVVKAQGLKKGEHPKKLGAIEVLSVRQEPLNHITESECVREGFPPSPYDFIEMFCRYTQCRPNTPVTRIEFRKVT